MEVLFAFGFPGSFERYVDAGNIGVIYLVPCKQLLNCKDLQFLMSSPV